MAAMSDHRVLVPLAPGFEEIEAVTIIDVLRRAGIAVVTAGLEPGAIAGSHGIAIVPDQSLDRVEGREFTAVVMPGGMPGSRRLRDDPRVQALLREFHEKAKVTAAICAAPIALGAAGILAGRRATSYPGFEGDLGAGQVELAAVVEDGPVITSRGVGTALPFALALVRRFRGEEASRTLAAKLLVTP
jgi:4-methyl-5(b-hydroxyethyl)-thiazole monophosphate biosynthesis